MANKAWDCGQFGGFRFNTKTGNFVSAKDSPWNQENIVEFLEAIQERFGPKTKIGPWQAVVVIDGEFAIERPSKKVDGKYVVEDCHKVPVEHLLAWAKREDVALIRFNAKPNTFGGKSPQLLIMIGEVRTPRYQPAQKKSSSHLV